MIDIALVTRALPVETSLPADTVFTDVTTDSRQLAPGTLLSPSGEKKFDGHAFVSKALAAGAAAAVVDHVPEGVDPGKCLVVKDTWTPTRSWPLPTGSASQR